MGKRYDTPEHLSDMAAEPMPQQSSQTLEEGYDNHTIIEGNDGSWDYDRKVPFGNSLDDVRSHLQEAIEHLDDPTYWKPWNESMERIRAKYAL